jgi:hypothetical protein
MQLCSFEGILNHILFPQDVSCSYEGAPMLLQKIWSGLHSRSAARRSAVCSLHFIIRPSDQLSRGIPFPLSSTIFGQYLKLILHRFLPHLFQSVFTNYVDRDRSVGIASRYGLDDPGIETWRGGGRFSAPVHTGSGAHSPFCITGTGSLSRG